MDEKYIIIDFDNLDIIKNNKIKNEIFVDKEEYIFVENNGSEFHFSDKIKKEHIFQINIQEYLKDISDSYKNLDSMKTQFIADVNRLELFYNFKKISNSQLFFDYLEYKYNIEMQKIIIMCSTQACMGLPFILLMKFLNKENVYLTDIYMSNLMNDLKKMQINFISSDNKLEFNVEKYLRICKINSNSECETLYIIKVNLSSDLINDKLLLMNIRMTKYI